MSRAAEFLKAVDIFSLLDSAEIDSVMGCLQKIEVKAGKMLFRQGDDGREMYIVSSGQVGISLHLPDGGRREIAEFSEGDFFGEMSIFEKAPRSATCLIKEDSRLYILKDTDFFNLLEQHPSIAIKIIYRMLNSVTRRLRGTSAVLSSLVRWGEKARKRAITDEMTGVYNRRFLDGVLPDLFRESEKEGKPLCLIMVDLDYFREINELYSHAMGDKVIMAVVDVFRKHLRDQDIIARYGGDEFTVVMPGTEPEKARDMAEGIRAEVETLDILESMNGPIKHVTTSQGLAAFPTDALVLEDLRVASDKALYQAKEEGRNRVFCASARTKGSLHMTKRAIPTTKEKNAIINNIIDALTKRDRFLLLGHQNPDEDCIASLVALALLIRKFNKEVQVYLGAEIHEHFQYLLEICRYNSIPILKQAEDLKGGYETVAVCDTPKPSMVEKLPEIDRLMKDSGVLHIEIDHHLAADSEYIGDDGYCLVDEASSASELVGQICLKLEPRKKLLADFQIGELFSRNMVLAILTGIVGDSKMGQFLKSKRERKFYEMFSRMFNELLAKQTTKESNFSNMDQVFSEIQRLSSEEGRCFEFFMKRKRFSRSVGYSTLSEKDASELFTRCSQDTVVSVSRSISDVLAEESGIFSLVSYYDPPDRSDLIQFRMRRSRSFKTYDLRKLLDIFNIENGGGHEGAIGFRIPRGELDDFEGYVQHLLDGTEEAIEDQVGSK